MPLTFAHPAVILPFSRNSKYFNFLAAVLGSMSPDFEYLLRGRPSGEIGHTFAGFIVINLPLVIIVYWIYVNILDTKKLSRFRTASIHGASCIQRNQSSERPHLTAFAGYRKYNPWMSFLKKCVGRVNREAQMSSSDQAASFRHKSSNCCGVK